MESIVFWRWQYRVFLAGELEITQADEEFVDSLVPPGSHSGFGFQDEVYPITGRAGSELGS